MMRDRSALVAAVVTLGFLGAPGGSSAAPAAPRRRPAVIRMTQDHQFLPQVVTIVRGEAVVWENEDERVHDVIGDPLLARHRSDIMPPSPPVPFHSGDIEPGARFRHSFPLAGIYRYVCRDHEEQGMNGTVIVTPEK
jgi:plastocyanin